MPIIGDVALKDGIRPERPMAASFVASQLAITASPISAAVVYYLAQFSGINESISLLSILMVTVPATLVGTLLLSLHSLRRGKEIADDPEYQRRLNDPVWRDQILHTTSTSLNEELPKTAMHAVILFILVLIMIVIVAMVSEIRTIGVVSACCIGYAIAQVLI